ncbi:type I methionyl aminopeptidase [Phycicoccus endophyticus]|uniref:Methionine aminopeptidase n=1 Tax=Phycicoccus endophyticus TaxID=1690220 RepID=A0A7G9QZ58_9MICO|nr:type I methionyl aminopeptidase [Phycicoccus endophyticus]NHI18979.1 type I methionyl aminopeptidase [Phycicoccus endophyticus]QNN48633.1 type I methionyl aminopeptidase [Phycicoccus endophyticus]GGL31816.1 methionine aminopeptidase [Phycicoccus endophyticus]
MGLFHRDRVEGRTPEQLALMRTAGLLVGRTLEVVAAAVRPGVTTLELDALAEAHIRDHGGVPNFQLVPGYRHTLCTSVNEEIVHGIPGGRVLGEGDLLSVDCGAEVAGWNGDAAMTLVVGGDPAARPEDLELSADTEDALWAGIAALRVGQPLYAVGAAVEDAVTAAGERRGRDYGIVEDYVGHGIGTSMHMDPQVPNYRVEGRSPTVCEGMTICIEPMVTLGDQDNTVLEDEWTVVTRDGARAAHWEHSIAVTRAGTCVLTAVDGGRERLASLGVPFLQIEPA